MKKKILVVDDDVDLLRRLDLQLKKSGYDVVFASDGVSAISVFRKEKPNLILLDIGLPAGDGFTVMQRLKSIPESATTPIIILTARTSLAYEKRALEQGADFFLRKPANIYELLGTIQKALKQFGGIVNEEQDSVKEQTDKVKKRILIVDDDMELVRWLNIQLRKNGYDVIFATDGVSAISKVRKEKPDMLILEIMLPAGDGFSVMKRLRATPDTSIPVIILTAEISSVNEKRAFKVGARAFLRKPVNNDELLTTIQKVFNES